MNQYQIRLRLKILIYVVAGIVIATLVFGIAMIMASSAPRPKGVTVKLISAKSVFGELRRITSPDGTKQLLVSRHRFPGGLSEMPIGWRIALGPPGFAFDEAEHEMSGVEWENQPIDCAWIDDYTLELKIFNTETMPMILNERVDTLGDVEVRYSSFHPR